MPPTTREAWLSHHRAARALHTFQQLAPREPFLVVKGVALVARYGWDPAAVPISDVDVRVTPRTWWRLRAALRADPRLRVDSPLYANLVLELENYLVDIEATCGPPFLTRLKVQGLLRRAELAQVPGAEPFLVPDTTDHALLLAINLFKDGLDTASQTARDNTLRLVTEPGFDIDRFVERAGLARMRGIARAVAGSLAPRSPTWRAVASALGPAHGALYSYVHAASHRRPASWPARIVRRLGSDSWRDRAVSLTLGAGFFSSGGR